MMALPQMPRSAAWLLCFPLLLGCRSVPPRTLAIHALSGCADVTGEATADAGIYKKITCELEPSAEAKSVVWARLETPAGVRPTELWMIEGAEGLNPRFNEDGRLQIEIARNRLPLLLKIHEHRSFLSTDPRLPTLQLGFAEKKRALLDERADKARSEQKIPELIAALQKELGSESSRKDGAAHAQLLHTLAELEADRAHHDAALTYYAEALALAQPAGLINLAANSARHLAFRHYTWNHDLGKATAILDAYDPVIRMIAIESALALYNRGIYAQEQGDLIKATGYLDQAERAASSLDDKETHRNIRIQRALVLTLQGLIRPAEKLIADLRAEIEKPADSSFEPCDRMNNLNTMGWARILEQESHSPGAEDPVILLQQALDYRLRNGCSRDGKNVERNWAHAELLRAERLVEEAAAASPQQATAASLEATEYLKSAFLHFNASAEPNQTRVHQMDAAELSGRIAYLQGRLDDAKSQFAEMDRLARITQEPDYRSRALLGKALVSAALARSAEGAEAAQYSADAGAAFTSAEALLDERLWWVPLTQTRRAFLPRFTAGTAAFIDFLLEQDDSKRALEVARRAQVRGLIVALSFDTLTLLPEPERTSFTQERDELLRYSAQLQARPDNAAGSPTEPSVDRLAVLATQLHEAGLDRQLPLHALQPGEAMHLCHPLPGDELACFVATSEEVRVKRLRKSALRDTSPKQRAELLLGSPLAPLIDRARVLRVVQSPELREVDFPALPWPGDSGYLASRQRLVVYALDLALPAAPAPPRQKQALMLANLSLAYAKKNAPWLYQHLQQLGWEVAPYSNLSQEGVGNLARRIRCRIGWEDCPPVLQIPVVPRLGTAAAMKQALPEVELAQLDTHANYGNESGWQSKIVMPDESALTATDLLMLKRAPRFTVLMVCEGGTTGHGSDPDDLSLAQALLLRGGEAVVATSRVLNDKLAAQWSQALYTAAAPQASQGFYLGAATPSLLQAFHGAQIAMRESRPSGWSALRLFVP